MTDTTLTAVRLQAQEAWRTFTRERNLTATAPDWHSSQNQDGVTTLSVQIVGRGAGHALRLFASQFHVVLREAGDTLPVFDYSVPGRTGCVWRSRGVWVELWVPDTAGAQPEPAQPLLAPPAVLVDVKPDTEPVRRRMFHLPSARLPFTRRHKETNPA